MSCCLIGMSAADIAMFWCCKLPWESTSRRVGAFPRGTLFLSSTVCHFAQMGLFLLLWRWVCIFTSGAVHIKKAKLSQTKWSGLWKTKNTSWYCKGRTGESYLCLTLKTIKGRNDWCLLVWVMFCRVSHRKSRFQFLRDISLMLYDHLWVWEQLLLSIWLLKKPC